MSDPRLVNEARQWLEEWVSTGEPRKDKLASLAALLERLCGEARNYSCQSCEEWCRRWAEAQKEIEQLREDYAEDWDKMNLAIVEMGKRAEKAESAIEQAREEGRREQREKDAAATNPLLNEASAELQIHVDRLAQLCVEDKPHDHSLLRRLREAIGILDRAVIRWEAKP